MSSAKENRSASTEAKPQKPMRPCPYIFLLGCGAAPGSDADRFVLKFVCSSRQLDCSKSEVIPGQAEEWGEDCRVSVARFVRKWLREKGTAFEDRRLLVRSYQTDDGPLAVAGYVPKNPSAVPSSNGDDEDAVPDSGGDDGEEIEFAESTAESVDSEPAAAADALKSSGDDDGKAPVGLADRLKSLPTKTLAIVGGTVALLVLLAVLIPMILPGGDDRTAGGGDESSGADSEGGPDSGPRPIPPPQFQTGLIRVYTGAAGFNVLVDGETVRDGEGNPVATPCEVTTEVGSRTMTVYREGFFDTSKVVDVTEDGEVTFTPLEDPDGTNSDALNAPWRAAEVGKPFPLEAVNSTRAEFDPYVTPDGLSLWFVGDRSDGRGIFVATRLSPFHDFGEPEQISRSADLPGTPSATDDALMVVYAVPEKARLFALTRDNPLGGFDKTPLRANDSVAPRWASAQILGDGLRIYWLEITGDKSRTLMWRRPGRSEPFTGRTLYEFSMPGGHPCLSQDGLRQYVFDGERVMRHRRQATSKTFGPPTVLAKLDLPDYVQSKTHRQYFVSSDDQWMFYCDNPAAGGDLFAVRISDGPGWGVRPTGKSIPPKPVAVAEVDPETQPAEIPEKPIEKPVDPRSLPLSYTAHWKIFKTLIANRQYDELDGLMQNAKSNPAMKPFAEQLAWDAEEFAQVRKFQTDIKRSLGELKKGETIRIAGNRVEFAEFKDGTIHATRAGTPLRRELAELRAAELTQFYDRLESSGDAEGDYRAGVFLSHDRDGVPRSAKARLDRAGRLGDAFRERIIRRLLVQAKGELERSKFVEGVAFLKQAGPLAKGLPIADEVSKLEGSLYEYLKWRQVGPRGWVVRGNEYEATLERKRGALLISEIEYENVEVTLEWKTENSTVAQGGVFFRYSGQGDPLENGFKIQLANDFGIAPDNFCTGALFRVDRPDVNAVKRAGEWNTLHLRVHGPDVVVTINGKKVLETVAVSPDKPKKGFVALDGVAGGITYRKILVSELPK